MGRVIRDLIRRREQAWHLYLLRVKSASHCCANDSVQRVPMQYFTMRTPPSSSSTNHVGGVRHTHAVYQRYVPIVRMGLEPSEAEMVLWYCVGG